MAILSAATYQVAKPGSLVRRVHYGYAPHQPDCPPGCNLHEALPKQRLLHTLPHREKAYGGAMGGAKTAAIANEVIRLAMRYPGTQLFVGRRFADDLRQNTMQEIFKFMPPRQPDPADRSWREWDYSPYYNEMVFYRYGSYVKFDNLERWKATFGPEYQAVFIDQAEEVDEQAALALLTRLRLPDETRLYNIRRTIFKGKPLTPEVAGFQPGEVVDSRNGKRHVPYYFVVAFNPEVNWVKEWFYDDAEIVHYEVDGQPILCYEKGAERIFIPAYSSDNPHLPASYVAAMHTMPQEWQDRYVKGMFIQGGETPFPRFDPAIHVIKPFAIPDHYLRFRSIDHGASKTSACACLWAASSGDYIFVYDEYLMPSLDVPGNVRNIHEREQCRYVATFIDPSTQKGGVNELPLIDQYERAFRSLGERVRLEPTGNNIDASVALINSLLRVDPALRHPITGQMGSPRLFFFENCTQTIRQVMEARWRQTASGQLTRDLRKLNMDLVDDLRYLCQGIGIGIRAARPKGSYRVVRPA